MKGIIFNLLERVVVEEYGVDTWDDLIDDAGVSGIYTSLGNYDDADIEALVSAAAKMTCKTRAEMLRWFGNRAMPILRQTYPGLFDRHASSQDFVLSVNDAIHPEVRKLYPDARCPFFHMSRTGKDAVAMRYESDREMLDLACGFLDGAAEVYGDTLAVEHDSANSKNQLTVRWM